MLRLNTSGIPCLLFRVLCVCLLCIITPSYAFAQKKQKTRKPKPPVLSIQSDTTATLPEDRFSTIPDNYKNITVVFGRLLKTLGDNRLPMPKLTMSRDGSKAVWVDFNRMEIGIEEKAYLTAHTLMGDTALAFLLAAPVMYYYDSGAQNKKSLPEADMLKTGFGPDSVIFYRGGFLAYAAGYGVFENGPKLMTALQSAYSLPDDAKLAGRKQGIRQADQKLMRMVEVFETGTLLTAVGRYQDAYAYYRFVLKDFQNKETLNNTGVAASLNALQYFRPNERESRFRFPFELEIESIGARDVEQFTGIRTRLLREAIGHFDAAIRLDSTYATARLNQASAYALLGEVEKADSLLQRTVSFPLSEKTASDLQVLRGILYDWKGDIAKAENEFKAAAEKNNSSALYNLDMLLGRTPKASGTSGTVPVIEKIDDWDLADNNNLPGYIPSSEIQVDGQIRFFHNRRPSPNSRFYLSHNAGTGRYSYFLLTGPGYAGETGRNLKTGALREAIIEAYGKPQRSIETPKGEVLVYSTILMILGPDGKLERWVLRGEMEE